MPETLGHNDSDEDCVVTNESGYVSSTSATSGGPRAILDTYHHDFLSFLSLAQQLGIDFMSITWQPALHKLGVGGSSQIMQSNMITKQLAFAFKRTVPRAGWANSGPAGGEKKRFKALISEILILKNSVIRDHRNINQLEGIAWEIENDVVWPVLVFPKANCGSLKSFIEGTGKEGASLEVKIRLCVDVALGLFALHRSSSLISLFDYHHRLG